MEREFLTKAIVLCSNDYKEKDKQITLFTTDSGRITAVLKGCKSPKAKLKFAYNPFCFAEFQIVEKNGFYTIINASLIDSFFDLSANYDKYILANIALDICNHIVRQDEPNVPMFLALVSTLKTLCYEQKNEKMLLIKFLLSSLENLGYKLSFKTCQRCEMPFSFEKYLDLSCGELVCQNCKTFSSIKLSNIAFNSLKIINETEIERFETLKLNEQALKEIIDVLLENVEARIERKLLSKKMLA